MDLTIEHRQALQEKLEQVRKTLTGFDRVIVAFSGGVDSSLLAKLARDVLGDERVLAVTADSPSLAQDDLQIAQRVAALLHVKHHIIKTHEVEDDTYQANTPGRCYICKRELFKELHVMAQQQGYPVVLYGAIGDDTIAERPGQRAAAEAGVRAPLQEAGLAKWEVRILAQRLGLPNWDRPQNACLSSRIPHGQEVTEAKLRQIEAAESWLRARGFTQVRVRHLGTRARIEVDPDGVTRFKNPVLCKATKSYLRGLGFASVSIDPAGYRPGGANRKTKKRSLAH